GRALRRARPRDAATRPGRRARTRRGHRPPPRPDAANRGRLPARARGGQLPAPPAGLALPRGRGTPVDRRGVTPREADEAGRGLARALLLLHGVHAPVAAALPRARGGDRRRLSP